jgi:hypothetical protein
MRDFGWPYLCVALCMADATAGAAAQPPSQQLLPDCGGVYDLCGFRNVETRELVIPRTFERALPFNEGLAAVRVKGRFGYIDTNGDMVIDPQFDLAGSFSLGLAEVLVGEHTGVIDRAGKFVIEPRFARSVPFTSEVVLAREGKWGSIHFAGREQLPGVQEQGGLFHGNSWGLFHVSKRWLTERTLNFSQFDKPSRGLIWATTGDYSRGPFGLMRADGTWQVEPQFTHVQRLMDERAIVAKPDPSATSDSRRELRGAVDPDGKLVVPLQDFYISYWDAGFATITKDGKQGLLDKAGNLVGNRMFDMVSKGAGYPRVKIDGKWVRIDGSGKLLAPEEGGFVVASCPSGARLIELTNGIQVQGPDGKPTLSYVLTYAPYFAFHCKRLHEVRVGDDGKPETRWSFLRPTDGKLLFDPPPFESVTQFLDGIAVVKRSGKWGIIDESGGFLVAPQFDDIKVPGARGGVNGTGYIVLDIDRSEFDKAPELFEVTKDGRTFAITRTGEERPLTPNDRRQNYLACGGGAKLFERNGLWGIVDADGRELIAPNYRALHGFRQGVAWAANDAKKMWCPIDADGSERSQPACVASRYPYMQTHSYPEKFNDDPYENSVLWTRAFLNYGAGKRGTPPQMIGDGGNGGFSSISR